MMNALVCDELFSSYKVCQTNSVSISHLQFFDDTLLVGNKSLENIRSLKAFLMLFEVISGLKLNFHKSMFVGINVLDSWLTEASTVLNCKTSCVPFFYLGLPIGGESRKLTFWSPLFEWVNSRLSGWKSRNLFFGGYLILLKYVMSSLLVYFIFFFKAPTNIIYSLEYIFNWFYYYLFRGGGILDKYLGLIEILFL